MQGKVEICGVNTAKLPVLKNEETQRLLARTKNGDKKAREELISGNLRLVLSVIQKFSGRAKTWTTCSRSLHRTHQGHRQLRHQPGRTFFHLRRTMIAGEIRRYLRDNSTIRVSRSVRDTAYRILQTKERLMGEKGREPSIEEIAEALGIRREEVVFALDAISDPVSLFEPVSTDGSESICVMDQVSDSGNTDESCWSRCPFRSHRPSELARKKYPGPALF